METILITGFNSKIAKDLIPILIDNYTIIGLSRSISNKNSYDKRVFFVENSIKFEFEDRL